MSKLEEHFSLLLLECKLKKQFIREHRFHPTRKWRIDFADLRNKIAVEIEGGVWTKGRHTTGSGFTNDCEKYNALTVLGWRLLRYSSIAQMRQFKEDYAELTK